MDSTSQKPLLQFYRRPLPEKCISFCSEEGKTVFTEALHSGHLAGYFSLAAQFRTQDEPAFCGLSTLVMVLNTLEVDPQRVWRGVWRWYHEDMLDCCVPLPVVKEKGINFDHFACLAGCNALNVKMTRTEKCSEKEFREVVQKVTKMNDNVVVVSYSRQVLQQTGDGHFSPIGGYNPGRDLVLILDTARFKYPPHWVLLATLWKAMQAIDAETGLSRGFFELSRRKMSPLVVFGVSPLLTLHLSSSMANVIPDSMQMFLKTWSSWLVAPTEKDLSERDIAVSAVECVTQSLTDVPADEFVLTTQIVARSTESMSYEHYQAVVDIVDGIEKLPLFNLAKEYANSKKCHDVDFSQSKYVNFESAGQCSDERHGMSELTLAHFVTMLVLSWPKFGHGYGACMNTCCTKNKGGDGEERQNNGPALQKYIDNLLIDCPEMLRVEVDQLQQQLALLMKYCRQCGDSSVHTSIK